jgi:hypothetical protein
MMQGINWQYDGFIVESVQAQYARRCAANVTFVSISQCSFTRIVSPRLQEYRNRLTPSDGSNISVYFYNIKNHRAVVCNRMVEDAGFRLLSSCNIRKTLVNEVSAGLNKAETRRVK